jgi:hypothetical protein
MERASILGPGATNFHVVAGLWLAFSMNKQRKSLTWNQAFFKILKDAGWLFSGVCSIMQSGEPSFL